MLSDRIQLSSAEARVEEIKGGSVGLFELSHPVRPSEDRLGIGPPRQMWEPLARDCCSKEAGTETSCSSSSLLLSA